LKYTQIKNGLVKPFAWLDMILISFSSVWFKAFSNRDNRFWLSSEENYVFGNFKQDKMKTNDIVEKQVFLAAMPLN